MKEKKKNNKYTRNIGKSKKLVLAEGILRGMASLMIKKFHPKIVGITGSVGKTSAKEATYSVLSKKFQVRRGEKNYNNEIGVPLTIIGKENKNTIGGWVKMSFGWFFELVFSSHYPEVLILEMGADRPGDIKYFTDFVKLDVGILTDISGSHLEFFESIEGVAREKSTLLKSLDEKKLAVINIDNEQIAKIKNQIKSRVMTFGFSEEADVRASDLKYNYVPSENGEGKEIKGLSFKLNFQGKVIPVRLNNILAAHSIYSALSAVCVGLEFGLNLIEICSALENFCLPRGRMTLIAGKGNTSIIDDTYNASPVSTLAALDVLEKIESQRKIVVLGDMLELGNDEEAGHKKVIKKVLDIKADIFLAVGKRMKKNFPTDKKNIFEKGGVFFFGSPLEATKKLEELVREGDLILVKGSQGMRMEKIVESLMLEAEKAGELLCRQDEKWKKKEWREV